MKRKINRKAEKKERREAVGCWKSDMPRFDRLRARLVLKKGEWIPQPEVVRFLLDSYEAHCAK